MIVEMRAEAAGASPEQHADTGALYLSHIPSRQPEQRTISFVSRTQLSVRWQLTALQKGCWSKRYQ